MNEKYVLVVPWLFDRIKGQIKYLERMRADGICHTWIENTLAFMKEGMKDVEEVTLEDHLYRIYLSAVARGTKDLPELSSDIEQAAQTLGVVNADARMSHSRPTILSKSDLVSQVLGYCGKEHLLNESVGGSRW